MNQGLFVGLITLDVLYLVEHVPQANQKMVALDFLTAAGGPATNAAVAFQYLSCFGTNKGDRTLLLGVLGSHPSSHLIRMELEQWGLAIADLAPTRTEPVPISSILITQATGERSVVSLNAVKAQATVEAIPVQIWDALQQDIGVVLVDGHQMQVGEAIAAAAKARQIPVVVDGGSWKPGFEQVLPYVDYAICSANFHPPGCQTTDEVLAYLQSLCIPHIAITQGQQPILYCSEGDRGEIPVPAIAAVDTLAAGDIFHGAFCHFIQHNQFAEALAQSAQVAARACQFFGPRRWMQ